MKYILVSHALCPYVQRAAIVLSEKRLAFERIDIDLSNKPEWFLRISPLGKTPVLLADGEPIFESAVICEYLEEVAPPHLHPSVPLARARHRGWMEFASAMLNDVSALYSAPDEATLESRTMVLRGKFAQLEQALDEGPYFSGTSFGIVDAAFAPLFRYFDVLEQVPGLSFFEHVPRSAIWRASLAARESVRDAVQSDYTERLYRFLIARRSALSHRMLSFDEEQRRTAVE